MMAFILFFTFPNIIFAMDEGIDPSRDPGAGSTDQVPAVNTQIFNNKFQKLVLDDTVLETKLTDKLKEVTNSVSQGTTDGSADPAARGGEARRALMETIVKHFEGTNTQDYNSLKEITARGDKTLDKALHIYISKIINNDQ